MNNRQKQQNFQSKLNTQQRCVNFVNHLDRIRVLATLCPVKSKVNSVHYQDDDGPQHPHRLRPQKNGNGPRLHAQGTGVWGRGNA